MVEGMSRKRARQAELRQVLDPAEEANREAALMDHIERRLEAIRKSGNFDAETMALIRSRMHVGAAYIAADLVRGRREVTREAREAVLAGIAARLPVNVACELAGVRPRTWYDHIQRDPELRKRVDMARYSGVDEMEARVEAWTAPTIDPETGTVLPATMAQVRAAELWLTGRDPRYRKGGGSARMQLTTPGGTFNASVGGPGD